MSHVENAALISAELTQGLLHTSPTSPLKAPRMRMRASDEETLDHYLKRVPPAIAASFTEEQRAALRTMLGGRGVTKHMVEVRRTIGRGRRRFYLVFLFGKDRRALSRAQAPDRLTSPFGVLAYLAGGAAALAAVVGFMAAAGY